VALTDDDIQYLEDRAYELGRKRSAAGKIPPPTDEEIWQAIVQKLDPKTFGEHPSDLDSPTSDDVRVAAIVYRRGYHGAPRED
jgi:hypothetical protein